jgi:hypothetical protein
MQVRFRLARGIPGLLRNPLIVADQHCQVVILGRRPSLHRGHNPVRRLSRLQYGCPLQQLAQSLVSKKFSRGIAASTMPSVYSRMRSPSLQLMRGVGILGEVESGEHQAVLRDLSDLALTQQQHWGMACGGIPEFTRLGTQVNVGRNDKLILRISEPSGVHPS